MPTEGKAKLEFPDPILKGGFLPNVDKVFWDRVVNDRESVEQSLEILKNDPTTSLIELAMRFGYFKGPKEKQHYESDWTDQEKGWFKNLPPVEPVLRNGLIAAIEASLKYDLPIDTYWVRGRNSIEVAVCRSRYQITFLVLTPPVLMTDLEPLPAKFREKDDIAIFRR